jgi:sugar transferase EpsL
VIRFAFLKRLGDVVLASLALILLAPVLAAVAVAVRVALGSPVLYADTRAGKDGRPIRIRKFRSMRQAFAADGAPLPDAERLGGFGRFLRRTSLDELPQLASVLVGDMSIVGPRPLPLAYVARYSRRQSLRLAVRPGLTGWAQIHGRNDLDWPERLEYDARYVEMLGRWYWPFVDLWIITATPIQIVCQAVTGRGVAAPGSATMSEFHPMTADDEAILRAVVAAIGQVFRDTGRSGARVEPPLLLAADLGLDSLDLAQVVVLLERAIGVDPFRSPSATADRPAVRTVADLVAIYRRAVGTDGG